MAVFNNNFRLPVLQSLTAVALSLTLLLSGCASKEDPRSAVNQQQNPAENEYVVAAEAAEPEAPAYADPRDPLESINRPLWDFNYDVLDKYLLRPATVGYMTVVPKPARKGLVNVVENLDEPASFLNGLLQAKPGRAAISAGRFLVNSTVGLLGIFDVASKIGLTQTDEDFNQTLAVWGVGDGAYFVLLGPLARRYCGGSRRDLLRWILFRFVIYLSLTTTTK